MIRRLASGLGLVAASVILSLITLRAWYGNLEANPTQAWIIFIIGFVLVSAAALVGVWLIASTVKIDRDEGT